MNQFCIYIYPFILRFFSHIIWASQVLLVVKKLPANAGNVGLIGGFRRSSEGEHGNPLHDSCLENPMDRGAWWATVHGVTKGWTGLKRLSMLI